MVHLLCLSNSVFDWGLRFTKHLLKIDNCLQCIYDQSFYDPIPPHPLWASMGSFHEGCIKT
jgi:hypothetical protein